MRLRFFVPMALALAAVPVAAAAQSSAGLTPDQISSTLESAGLAPSRDTNDAGEVYFTVAMTGTDGERYGVVVAPHECTGSTPRCRIVTLYANYSWGTTPDAAALAKLISYNDSHYRGRTYMFGETVGIDYQIFLGEGAGQEYLAARVAEFPQILADFVALMKN